MLKLLYISASIPYDTIRHAGGQTLNFYVKNFLKYDEIETRMIGLCKESEKKYFDKEKIGLKCYPITTRGTLFTNIKRVVWDLWGRIFLQDKDNLSYYLKVQIEKRLKKLKKEEYEPDIIIFEWTAIVLQIDNVKKFYPEAKCIASEHDVSFLGLERKFLKAPINKKGKAKKAYEKMKQDEIHALGKFDVVMPHNIKDANLLITNGISPEKIFILTPYYHDMSNLERKEINHDVLFWGAMGRPENYEAAIWFINNVMPLLSDTDVRFLVAGNNPPKVLKSMSSDKVVVTGFIEDETSLFAHSLCFVAPFLTGAGIKVKIIEALSAGIPILTNDIGIEGIPCIDGENFFRCLTPEEYARVIRLLIRYPKMNYSFIDKERDVVKNNFDLDKACQEYVSMVLYLNHTGRVS